jgi:hypothetical protein
LLLLLPPPRVKDEILIIFFIEWLNILFPCWCCLNWVSLIIMRILFVFGEDNGRKEASCYYCIVVVYVSNAVKYAVQSFLTLRPLFPSLLYYRRSFFIDAYDCVWYKGRRVKNDCTAYFTAFET